MHVVVILSLIELYKTFVSVWTLLHWRFVSELDMVACKRPIKSEDRGFITDNDVHLPM